MNELMNRPGYQATRYRADSATVFVERQEVRLQGKALTERQGSLLEADTITYRRDSCLLAPRAIRTCSTRARCWWARESATTPAAGAG